jgi:hypothetical protein
MWYGPRRDPERIFVVGPWMVVMTLSLAVFASLVT